MASLAENVARVISVFNVLKSKVKSYVAMNDFLNPLKIEEYVNAIDDVFKCGEFNGKQSQYDEFWDAFQQNGSRTFYRHAFSGWGWTADTFKPKYNITPTDCARMFEYCRAFNLKEKLKESNVKLDLSNVTDVSEMFYYAFMGVGDNVIPDIWHKRITNATNCFYVATGIKTIENFTVAENCNVNMAFFRCDELENLTVGNTIGANGWDFLWSPKLSHDSIVNIIEHLSPATTGLSIRFKKSAVNTAFGINVDDETTYTEEWTNLINSKSNWTIAFA